MNQWRVLAMLLLLVSAPAYAYTTQIRAPAVLIGVDRGILTTITLNVTPGNGTVLVNPGGTGTVALDTRQSVLTAVRYASSYLAVNESRYNFRFQIGNNDSNVSGPSAGLALTLLTMSGLEQRPMYSDFALTGTINPNGTVGQIGGVFDKVQASKSVGARFMLVPYAQNSSEEYLLYYLSQQTYGVPLVEVANVSQAVPYAFGRILPSKGLQYNITTDYQASQLENVSEFCPSCNVSGFAPLTNFTFNLTSQEIGTINGTMFGSVKSQLYSQLAQYSELASKGYMYTGADLAFNEYPTAFVFANYNESEPEAYALMQNISDYCNSLSPPQMTESNYELVVGGETRQAWAEVRLQDALSSLNQSQTSDEVLESIQDAAPSLSWCEASGEMYKLSADEGGAAVYPSQLLAQDAAVALQRARSEYGYQFYVDAANYSASVGDYAAELYSIGYADVFYNTTYSFASNLTQSSRVSSFVSKTLGSASGLWPTQFAVQGYFYLAESGLSPSNSSEASGYLYSAYSTALLSSVLSGVNSKLQSGFTAGYNQTQPQGQESADIAQMSEKLTLILGVLVVLLLIVFAILVLLIVMLLQGGGRGGSVR